MQIYVGNLSKMTTALQLANLFLPFGTVRGAKISHDSSTGYSMGFGFIEMEPQCGRQAIIKLNRLLFMNSYVEVSEIN